MASETGVRAAKGILYVLSRVAIVGVVILLLVVAYFTSVNTMMVNMITKDAFAKRAQAVLMPEDANTEVLSRLFTQNAFATDTMMNSTMYQNFSINSFYERADIGSRIVWAWSDKATIKVTETVLDIVGKAAVPEVIANSGDEEAIVAAENVKPPAWENGAYEVKLLKDKKTDSWKIDSLVLKEAIAVVNATEESPRPDAMGSDALASPDATQVTG